jgi:hypothetical protein
MLLLGGGNYLGYVGDIISDTLQMNFFGKILAWLLPLQKPVRLEAEDIKERFVEIIDLRCTILLVENLMRLRGNTAPGDGLGLG